MPNRGSITQRSALSKKREKSSMKSIEAFLEKLEVSLPVVTEEKLVISERQKHRMLVLVFLDLPSVHVY